MASACHQPSCSRFNWSRRTQELSCVLYFEQWEPYYVCWGIFVYSVDPRPPPPPTPCSGTHPMHATCIGWQFRQVDLRSPVDLLLSLIIRPRAGRNTTLL